MAEERPPSSLDELDARLKAARQREAAAEGDAGAREARRQTQPSGLGLAFRIGAELVAGLAVGCAIGWALDAWLGTGPWLLILFFFLGAAAGMLNVYRVAAGYGLAAGFKRGDEGTGNERDGDKRA